MFLPRWQGAGGVKSKMIKQILPSSSKQVEYENVGTKSFDISDIMVYLAMFSTTIDKILCFSGPHKMKMSHHISVSDTLWNLGLF